MVNYFYLGGKQLWTVRPYKYLGFLSSVSGEIKRGFEDLRDRGFKAFMKLKNQMGTSFNQNIEITLNLVGGMIKPSVLNCLK